MKRKLIGQVGVDSGQLMVIDPCYINSQWKSEGKAIGIQFWGQGQDDVAALLKELDEEVVSVNDTYRIMTENEIHLHKLEKDIQSLAKDIEKTVVSTFITDSTYDEICDLTLGEDQAGQMNYRKGHAGLGVAFSSGLGDGVYDVYATYKDMGSWGERISKVEIVLIDENELEEED